MVSHMLAIVRSIIAIAHPRVIIVSRLFWFPRYEQLPNCITDFNSRFQLAVEQLNRIPEMVEGHTSTRVVFWKHQFGIWGGNSRNDLFLSDRVHLNPTGLRRYYFSVRQSVGPELRALQ